MNETTSSTNKGNLFLGIGLAVLLSAAAFFSGLHVGSGATSGPMQASLFSFFSDQEAPDSEADLGEYWRVWHLLEDKFVAASTTDGISETERVEGSIKGLVSSYHDPYTVFFPPADASQFEDDISGNFGGVGMEVGERDGLVTIIAPLPETPAEKAGILAGDVIVKIDGKTTEDISVDEAVRLIRGEVGTDVALTIYREGESEFLDITITRDLITIPTIKTEVVNDVFIIRLYNFNALSEMKMQEAMREYVRGGYSKLILDLRGNPGGFLQSAVAIAGYFLPTGKVVVRESFGDAIDEQVYRSQGRVVGTFSPDNFVVLVDGGSASASEILSGALKEHEVATTIGTKTFGKGSVQELVDLPSGASLKVTVARWLTPNGVSFSAGGLDPNVTISRTAEQVITGEDPQQAAALEWLAGNHNIGEETDPIALLDQSPE